MFNNLGISSFIIPSDIIASFELTAVVHPPAANSPELLTASATMEGSAGDDVLVGTSANDALNGEDGDDTLSSLGGNDTLDGGRDNDLLDGGAGNDMVRGGYGNDVISQANFKGDDQLDGGYDLDTVDYSAGENGSSITIDLTRGSAVKFINGVKVGSDAIRNIERLFGTAQGDHMTGSGLAETLAGGAGYDTLSGGDSNDVLIGGDGNDLFVQDHWAGSDMLWGGEGHDVLRYAPTGFTGARIVIDLQAGTVTKYLDSVEIGVDWLSEIEEVIDATQGADQVLIITGATVAMTALPFAPV